MTSANYKNIGEQFYQILRNLRHMDIRSLVKSSCINKIPFIHRFYRKILETRLPNHDLVLPCHGLKILVRNPRQSVIGESLYLKGLWEPEETEIVFSKIKQGMTVLDIGADIGYYTLLFAKLVGQNGRVFSFEPIPKAKSYLDKNIDMNGFNNVISLDFALFDKEGTACLEDPFIKSKINLTKKRLSGNDIQVEMKIFDDWKSNKGIGNINFVKIDVEGAELNVLRGMVNTLQKQHPAMIIEVHPEHLRGFGFSPNDFINLLREFDYQLKPVDMPKIDFSKGNITLFCQ